jgi:hypothetical protein
MRKIDWVAMVFVVVAGAVMGALWLDIRAMYWSAPTAWDAANLPHATTTIRFTLSNESASAEDEPCEAHGDETGNDAVTANELAPASEESYEPDCPDLDLPDVELPDVELVEPLTSSPVDFFGCLELDNGPPSEPVKVTVTLQDLEPMKSQAPVGMRHDDKPIAASDTQLQRFDPLAKPVKNSAEIHDPRGTLRGLEEILQTSGSAAAQSKELFGDEESRQEYLRELRQQILRLEEERAMASPPPAPPAWCSPQPSYPIPASPATVELHEIDTLREAAGELDDIANRLERRNLFIRADQLRAAAQEMRLDARKASHIAAP